MNPVEKEKKFKGKGKPRKEVKREKDPKIPEEKPVYKKGPNDIRWRTDDAVMTELVAKLTFGVPAGLSHSATISGITQSFTQPGILSVGVKLTAGHSIEYTSAWNLCVRKLYSFVRHANSGSRNYEAVDMGIYLSSVGQSLGLLGHLQRADAIIDKYSVTNRYQPRTLLRAMGFKPDDLLNHQPQLKYLIAWLGRAIGSLAFPDLAYFHACYEAFQYVFRDNDSPKEQLYMLVPRSFGYYNPTYDANGGGLEYQDSNTHWNPSYSNYGQPGMTYDDIRAYTMDMMDILLGDEDIGIISGDILKAFNNGQGLFVPKAFGDYDPIIKSEEMLQQIHNLTIIHVNNLDLKGYKQDPGSINLAPYLKSDIITAGGWANDVNFCEYLSIDAFSRDPDPKEVVNCTVLNPQVKIEAVGGGNYNYSTTHISFDLFLPSAVFFTEDLNSVSDVTNYFAKCGTSAVATTIGVGTLRITNFDWHPIIWTVTGGTIKAVGDLQNYRFFEYDIGKRIHDNSLLSLLNFKELNFVKN